MANESNDKMFTWTDNITLKYLFASNLDIPLHDCKVALRTSSRYKLSIVIEERVVLQLTTSMKSLYYF